VAFGPVAAGSRLLVASDGLFKYVAEERIRELALLAPRQAAVSLTQAARLPNGRLQDDLAVIVASPADQAFGAEWR
jgi:hypothetical protein